jgi:hypothetical protein
MTTPSRSNEIWRDIPGYEGRYQASNLGRIRSQQRGLLKPFINHNGYMVAPLTKEGEKVRTGAHRLVAQAFIPNPENKEQINHKNGIKTDNRVENLEWVTCSENNLHRRRVLNGGGGRPARPVVCLTTGERFPSITAAAQATGSTLVKILQVCQGKRKRTNGMAWAYAEEVAT